LQGLREASGLSQRDFAEAVGIGMYTFISQIERGRARVPPAQVRVWSEVLNVPVRDFAITLMMYYDPLTHDLIFGNEAVAPQSPTLERRTVGEGMELGARISKLEARIAKIDRRVRRIR
jgi:transcriptional regulator with XRE-family HTH domain